MSSEIEREILRTDDARYRAMLAEDYAFLDCVLGDDLVYTDPDFGSASKAEYLTRMRFGTVRYRDAKRRFGIVRLYGGTAVMHGEVSIRIARGGTERTVAEAFVNVWVKRHLGWQMVAWASTCSA
jgi:hypothetical protein